MRNAGCGVNPEGSGQAAKSRPDDPMRVKANLAFDKETVFDGQGLGNWVTEGGSTM